MKGAKNPKLNHNIHEIIVVEFYSVLIVTNSFLILGYTILYKIVYPESYIYRVLFLYRCPTHDFVV